MKRVTIDSEAENELSDSVTFYERREPGLGLEFERAAPDVIPGEYANGWTPSPGPKRVLDRTAWPKLEAYVRAVVGRFHDDPRVLGWDIYNEPSNTQNAADGLCPTRRSLDCFLELSP